MIAPSELTTQPDSEVDSRIAFIEAELARLTAPGVPAPKPLDWPAVLNQAKDLVCAQTGVSRAEIDGHRRHQNVAEARFIAMHLMRRFSPLSSTQIGALFDLDHATILNGLRRLRERMETHPHTRAMVRNLDLQFSRRTGLSRRPS
jgi:hypothetical protein